MFSDRSNMIDRFRERLEEAEQLAGDARAAMLRHDIDSIEEATSRLRTVATECRLLNQELCRAPEADDRSLARRGAAVAEERAMARLEETAVRVARAAAIGGGILHGLVEMSRRLLEILTDSHGVAYSRDGRATHAPAGGMQLRELA